MTDPSAGGGASGSTTAGEPLAPVGCGAITVAAANTLLAKPITTVTVADPQMGYYPDHHFVCDASLQITIYPQDSSKQQYSSDLADENVTPTTIPGVGDVTVFTQSGIFVQGAGPMPDVYVHQGAATCEIKTSSTVSDYNIPASGGTLSTGVTKSAAVTWATKAAGLCIDVFNAIKA